MAAVPFGGPVAAIRDDCKIVQLYSESQCSLSLHLDILFAMAEVMAASFEALDRHRECQSENPHSRLTSPLYPPPPPRKRLHKCRSHISIAFSSCSNRTSKSNFSWGIDGAIQEFESHVVEIIKSSKRKARTKVDAAVKAD